MAQPGQEEDAPALAADAPRTGGGLDDSAFAASGSSPSLSLAMAPAIPELTSSRSNKRDSLIGPGTGGGSSSKPGLDCTASTAGSTVTDAGCGVNDTSHISSGSYGGDDDGSSAQGSRSNSSSPARSSLARRTMRRGDDDDVNDGAAAAPAEHFAAPPPAPEHAGRPTAPAASSAAYSAEPAASHPAPAAAQPSATTAPAAALISAASTSSSSNSLTQTPKLTAAPAPPHIPESPLLLAPQFALPLSVPESPIPRTPRRDRTMESPGNGVALGSIGVERTLEDLCLKFACSAGGGVAASAGGGLAMRSIAARPRAEPDLSFLHEEDEEENEDEPEDKGQDRSQQGQEGGEDNEEEEEEEGCCPEQDVEEEEQPSLTMTDGSSSSWEETPPEKRQTLEDVAAAVVEVGQAKSFSPRGSAQELDPSSLLPHHRRVGSLDTVERLRFRTSSPPSPVPFVSETAEEGAPAVPYLPFPRGTHVRHVTSDDADDHGVDDRYESLFRSGSSSLDSTQHSLQHQQDLLRQDHHRQDFHRDHQGQGQDRRDEGRDGASAAAAVAAPKDWPGECRHEVLCEERRHQREQQGQQEQVKVRQGREDPREFVEGRPAPKEEEDDDNDNAVASSLAALTENVADILLCGAVVGGAADHHAKAPKDAGRGNNWNGGCCADCSGGLCTCLDAPCGWPLSSTASSGDYDVPTTTWLATLDGGDSFNGTKNVNLLEATRVLLEREVEAWRRSVEAEIARLMGSTSDAASAQLMALRSWLSFFVGAGRRPSSSSSSTSEKSPPSSSSNNNETTPSTSADDDDPASSARGVLIRNRAAVMHAQARRIRTLRGKMFPAAGRSSFAQVPPAATVDEDTEMFITCKSTDEMERGAAARRRRQQLTLAGKAAAEDVLTSVASFEDASSPWAAATAFVDAFSGDWHYDGAAGPSTVAATATHHRQHRPGAASEGGNGKHWPSSVGSEDDDDELLCYDSDPGELASSTKRRSALASPSSTSRPPRHPLPRRSCSMFESHAAPPSAITNARVGHGTTDGGVGNVNSSAEDGSGGSSSNCDDSSAFSGDACAPTQAASVLHSVDVKKFDINDDDLVSSFIKELTTGNISLVWHPFNDSNNRKPSPVCVEAWFEMGSRLKSKVVQPKFMWREAYQPNLSLKKLCASSHTPESVELLNIVRILKPSAIDRKLHPFAKLQNSFTLLSSSDEVFLFETSSEDERDRFVHGLKLVVARLASKIIVGDEDVFAEFFTPWGQSPEALSPSPSSCGDDSSYCSSSSFDEEEAANYMRGDDLMSVTSHSITSSVREESQRKDELWGVGAA